jgi:hypothetical protein
VHGSNRSSELLRSWCPVSLPRLTRPTRAARTSSAASEASRSAIPGETTAEPSACRVRPAKPCLRAIGLRTVSVALCRCDESCSEASVVEHRTPPSYSVLRACRRLLSRSIYGSVPGVRTCSEVQRPPASSAVCAGEQSVVDDVLPDDAPRGDGFWVHEACVITLGEPSQLQPVTTAVVGSDQRVPLDGKECRFDACRSDSGKQVSIGIGA